MSSAPESEAGVAPGAGPESARRNRVESAIREWTKHLVDLGGRNTLLWYRDLRHGTLDLTTAHPSGLAKLLSGKNANLSELFREPDAFQDALRRTRAVASKSAELLDEFSLATCFLAIGVATWKEESVPLEPAAPVLLRGATLRPTSAVESDFIVAVSDDVVVNPVLVNYLQTQRGITVDTYELEEMATAGPSFNPAPVFRALTQAAAAVPAFTIYGRLIIANFSYAKLPLIADLAEHGAAFADLDLVAAFAGDHQAQHRLVAELPPRELGDPDPARERVVLDIDAAQESVVDEVVGGASLVVQGAPGTGKTQTITNLAAALMAQGQSVLVVAEKHDALSSIHSRLANRGLGDLVFDASSGRFRRRELAQNFVDTLDGLLSDPGPTQPPQRPELLASREVLSLSSHALHQPRQPWGISAYEAQETIAALEARIGTPASGVRLPHDVVTRLAPEELPRYADSISRAVTAGAWSPSADVDPWFGARIRTPAEAAEARERVERLAQGSLARAHQEVHAVFDEVGLAAGDTPAQWGEMLRLVASVRGTLEVFRPEIFDIPLDDMVAATSSSRERRDEGVKLSSLERRRLRAQAKELLRPGPPPMGLHEALLIARSQRSAWRQLIGGGARPELPTDLGQAEQAYAAVSDDLNWLSSRMGPTSGGGDFVHQNYPQLLERIKALHKHQDRLQVVPQVRTALEELRGQGLGPVVDDFAARRVPTERIADELELIWWSSVLDDIGASDAWYGSFSVEQMQAAADAFVDADRDHLAHTSPYVRAAVAASAYAATAAHPDQDAALRDEADKLRRRRALFELMSAAGDVMVAARPCWLISPLLVPAALPQRQWFDVVVIDGGSHIATAAVISSLARARRVVVFGDPAGVPPTAFQLTPRSAAEPMPHDDDDPEVVDSVFDDAAFLPVRRLNWHYRSGDIRLTGIASELFYNSTLTTFPGVPHHGPVRLHFVDAAGPVPDDDHAIESTENEVKAVVVELLQHAREAPHRSFGVVTFSEIHAERIGRELRRRLVEISASEPDVVAVFAPGPVEPFYIKTLPHAVGDERDDIILAVGFGKTPYGRVLHRFGSLGQSGGERQLALATTLPRRSLTVVTSLRGADLDPSKLRSPGGKALRELLLRIEHLVGHADPLHHLAAATDPEMSSEVVRDFARRLRAAGFTVIESVGSPTLPVELAVFSGNAKVAIAIEADGLQYAAQPSRERDRLRPEQLARLGWIPVRVWTTDLFRDPGPAVARIVSLAAAHGAEPTPPPDPDDEPFDGDDRANGSASRGKRSTSAAARKDAKKAAAKRATRKAASRKKSAKRAAAKKSETAADATSVAHNDTSEPPATRNGSSDGAAPQGDVPNGSAPQDTPKQAASHESTNGGAAAASEAEDASTGKAPASQPDTPVAGDTDNAAATDTAGSTHDAATTDDAADQVAAGVGQTFTPSAPVGTNGESHAPERASTSRRADGGHAPKQAERTTDQTTDDTDIGWGDAVDESRDQWLKEQRPPHWE